MSKLDQAFDVLTMAQEQLISELAQCGQAGGIGRAQNFSPVLVNVSKALAVVKGLLAESASTTDRMANMRAAKAAKQAQPA